MREPNNRRVRPIAAASACGAWWAFCEVVWNTAVPAENRVHLIRLAALGWVPLGPVALHALVIASSAMTARMRTLLNLVYGVECVFLLLALATPLLVPDVVRTPWSWAPVPGPLLPVQYAITAGCGAAGLLLFARSRTRERERGPRSLVSAGAILLPLVVGSVTDVILPLLGDHSLPRLATLSLACIGVTHVFSLLRWGDASLVPERLSERVLDNLPDGVASLSMGGHIRTVNERMATLLGTTADALIGSDFSAFLPAGMLSPARELSDEQSELTPVQGTAVPCSLSISIQRDRRGDAWGLLLIAQDLREVTSLRRRLDLSARLAAVGELAAGIAHELNNPIAYVRTNLSVLRELCDENRERTLSQRPLGDPKFADEMCEIVDESIEGIDRAARIVRDVREFSHSGAGERAPAELSELVEQSVRVARLQIAKDVRVELDLGELPPVECDAQRIKQVLLNLLVNAGQAVSAKGLIAVRTWRDGDFALVGVKDNGCGIAAEDQGRIFDPFFTTKPVGVGTGLGLAIAYGILQEHGGSIDVESQPGHGAEFRLRLPLSRESSA